jgi:hypothetical protein
MISGSSEYDELNKLLSKGYLIAEPVHRLAQLNSQTIERFRAFFSIKTDVETLLAPSNRAKFLLTLGHPVAGDRIEILMSDDMTMRRVQEQLAYQNEQIGTIIRARCAAVDNSTPERQTCHGLDRLVTSLNGHWGWKFTLLQGIPPAFQVEIRLGSMQRSDIEEAKDKLKRLLDCLAVSQKVGFYIQDIIIGPIRRCSLNPYVIDVGPLERLLEGLNSEEIARIQSILSSDRAQAAARGLNQAYVESFAPSRLSMLWAAAEDVFDVEPELLLSKEEIKILLDAVKGIETLRADSERMLELKSALSDPKRLSRKNRNRRMAANIAPIMGTNEEEAYAKVRQASELRGKQLHRILTNWGGLQSSMQFLEEALRRYLSQ